MTKWLANFSNHTVGTDKTFATLTHSGALNNGELLNYGLGITVDSVGGVARWSHSGSSAGYRSMLVYLPEHDRGYIYQTSTPSNGSPAAKLTQAFLGDVLQIPKSELNRPRPQIPEAVVLENPAIYSGQYLSDELEAFYSVELNGDMLSLFHRWLGESEMRYIGDDTFLLMGRGGTLSFSRDAQDKVNGFVFDNGRTIGVEFRRMEQ